MKKFIILFVLLISSVFIFAESNNISKKDKEFLYILNPDEMNYFTQSYAWLKNWEAGNFKVSDKEIAEIYEEQIGKQTITSMLYENFFRNTKNKDIQKQMKDYIQKNKLSDKPFEKVLLKKYDSKEKNYEQENKKLIQYSYNDTEFDENINLFDFNEVHPFDDELGLLLFENDYHILQWKSFKTDEYTDNKELLFIAGGGTNSVTIKVKEFDNVSPSSKDEIIKIANIGYIANKYKDDWVFIELDKKGVLENCGVDNYYIGYGINSDVFISDIAAGDFVTCMYKKDTGKVYLIYTYMNFSKININYEIKNRLFNYILFFTQFCYCD